MIMVEGARIISQHEFKELVDKVFYWFDAFNLKDLEKNEQETIRLLEREAREAFKEKAQHYSDDKDKLRIAGEEAARQIQPYLNLRKEIRKENTRSIKKFSSWLGGVTVGTALVAYTITEIVQYLTTGNCLSKELFTTQNFSQLGSYLKMLGEISLGSGIVGFCSTAFLGVRIIKTSTDLIEKLGEKENNLKKKVLKAYYR